MCHPLLSPSCMATIILCLRWAASSHANSTGPGGLAPAACLGLPLTEGEMAGGPTLSHAHTASSALSPQRHSSAPPAQRGGHKITSSPGFVDVAPGNRETKGSPMVAFVTEVNMRLWKKTCQAEQGTIILLDECCFWNDIVWSFSHHASRCLAHALDLIYYGLILPLCMVTSITGIQLLARYMKSYQSQRKNKQQRKEQWPESPPSMVWAAANYLDCAICLRTYQPGERLKVLACSHAYHSKCIDLWHRAQHGSRTCPLCLRSVTAVALILLGAHNKWE